MVCHCASETHRAENYQLGDKKETAGQAAVKAMNPKVGLLQNKWHVPVLPTPSTVLLFPGLDADTDQVSITLSGRNHF